MSEKSSRQSGILQDQCEVCFGAPPCEGCGNLAPRRLVATLAHELQHAVEIADAEDVVDEASLARAYARMGEKATLNVRAVQTFETREAVDTGQRVWREYGSSSADD